MSDMAPDQLSLEDRFKILDLYARQAHAVDGGDGEAWAATFTEDARFVAPTYKLTAHGRGELSAFAVESNQGARQRGEQLRHVVTAIAISPKEDSQVDVRSYLTIIATSETGSRVDRSVIMVDVLRRAGDGWLVASREALRDPWPPLEGDG